MDELTIDWYFYDRLEKERELSIKHKKGEHERKYLEGEKEYKSNPNLRPYYKNAIKWERINWNMEKVGPS